MLKLLLFALGFAAGYLITSGKYKEIIPDAKALLAKLKKKP